jgi:nitroimidazol reductase NimA-like FMN-containing flavoprotein (pyridoxamine 5'-phosphate oxidase superfamily)
MDRAPRGQGPGSAGHRRGRTAATDGGPVGLSTIQNVARATIDPTPLTQVRRHPDRACYERDAIYAILDEGLVCHLGFVAGGRPWVIPTMYARKDDFIYIHGSPASRMLKRSASGANICLTVTLLDGLVLARSAASHSMNYRSVVVIGRAELVKHNDQKLEALRALVDHVIEGRWEDARQPTAKELKATMVLRLNLSQASAKVRQGPPVDSVSDQSLQFWAGEIPIKLRPGKPIPAPGLRDQVSPPSYVRDYHR